MPKEKEKEKEEAIRMRREGKTYNEILDKVPVAKSTLAIWFKEVNLAKSQEQRMTDLRAEVQKKGAEARRENRLKEIDTSRTQGMRDVGRLTVCELWLVGIALHWAKGSKQSVRVPSQGVIFNNSDPKMLVVFLWWLEGLGVSDGEISFSLYAHTNRKSDIPEFKKWWACSLGIKETLIKQVYLKQGNPKTKRSNVGDLYHGLIRIKVEKSTSLNRQAQGWFNAIHSAVE